MSSDQVTAWKRRVKEITRIVEPLLSECSILEQRIVEAESPFKVKDIIEWKTGYGNHQRAVRGRVEKIGQRCGGLRLRVRRFRKDGSEGAMINVYVSHDKPTVVQSGDSA